MGQATPAIEALQRMGAKLDADLKALVRYYGEEDGMKPEEVFGIIVKFSSALLVRPLFIYSLPRELTVRYSELRLRFERRTRNRIPQRRIRNGPQMYVSRLTTLHLH